MTQIKRIWGLWGAKLGSVWCKATNTDLPNVFMLSIHLTHIVKRVGSTNDKNRGSGGLRRVMEKEAPLT